VQPYPSDGHPAVCRGLCGLRHAFGTVRKAAAAVLVLPCMCLLCIVCCFQALAVSVLRARLRLIRPLSLRTPVCVYCHELAGRPRHTVSVCPLWGVPVRTGLFWLASGLLALPCGSVCYRSERCAFECGHACACWRVHAAAGRQRSLEASAVYSGRAPVVVAMHEGPVGGAHTAACRALLLPPTLSPTSWQVT
jgi:hypothetical protein